MAKLHSLAKLMRSKNAGPFSLTYDIMFENVHSYRHAIENNVLGTEISSRHLGVEPQLIPDRVETDPCDVVIASPCEAIHLRFFPGCKIKKDGLPRKGSQ